MNGGGEQKGPPPENMLYISYNDTVILYLRKIQKTNKSQDSTPEFADIRIFSTESSNFCNIKIHKYRLHSNT